MIKPDYIPFSQEIFDEIEGVRHRLLEEPKYRNTPEFSKWAFLRVNECMCKEYSQYLVEQKKIK